VYLKAMLILEQQIILAGLIDNNYIILNKAAVITELKTYYGIT
jgi:hypothetical protein